MSNLNNSRFARLLNTAFRKLARRGVLPTYQKTLDTLKAMLKRNKQGSVLEPVVLKNGNKFPVDGFNENLEQIKFDINLLNDQALYVSDLSIEGLLISEEKTAELRKQLKKVREQTERELLLSRSNFIDALVIRFADRANVDLAESTADINTELGRVTIPTKGGSRRVMPQSPIAGPIELETQDFDGVVLPGSDFSAIFTDAITSWHIKTNGTFVRIRIDLGGSIEFNRVEIKSPNESANIELRLSPDGINFIRPVDSKSVKNAHVDFYFQTKTSKFIELFIKLNSKGETVFSIDDINFYNDGYQDSGILTTIELAPEDEGTIKQVRVDLDADIPNGTSVKIEAFDGTSWASIDSNILDFTKSTLGQTDFVATSTVTRLSSYSTVLGDRGYSTSSPTTGLAINDVWKLGINPTNLPSIGAYDLKSIRLYRNNNWGFKTHQESETLSENNVIMAEFGEATGLARHITDEVVRQGSSDGPTISLSRDIQVGSNIPLFGGQEASIQKVHGTLNVAKTWVGKLVVGGTEADRTLSFVYTSGTFPTNITSYQSVTIKNTNLSIADIPILSFDIDNSTLILNPTTDISIFGGTITGLTASIQTRDLSPLIGSIDGNVITFSENILAYETVVIEYLSPLVNGIEDVIINTVKVKQPGNELLEVEPGIDYRIDGNTITVLNTSGSSGSIASIIVDFKYTKKGTTFCNYWTYATVDNPKIVKFNSALSVDAKERILWTNPSGKTIDLNGASSINLSKGIHLFTVNGKLAVRDQTGSSSRLDVTSAIYKLINLTTADSTPAYIFKEGNGYFSRITGYLEPLVLTSRFYLDRIAKKDELDKFSVDNAGLYSLIKWDQPQDALKIEPNNTSLVSNADYKIVYRYFHDEGISSIKIRLTLSREPGTSPEITPVVRGLIIRYTE